MKTKAEIGLLSVVISLVGSMIVPTAFAQTDPVSGKKPIVRYLEKIEKRYKATVGVELGSEGNSIRLLDLKTFREVIINKDHILSKKHLTDQEAVNHIGLARFTAWSLKQKNLIAPNPRVGRIASVGDAVVFINRGRKQGVTKGEQFDVFRGNREIKDPETGEVLGSARRKIGRIEIVEVRDKLSTAKLLGKPESELKVGDEVEPTKKLRGIAVLPLTNTKGKIVKSSVETANETVAIMNELGMDVVEIIKLKSVLDKQVVQNSNVLDEKTIRKVGDLVGARSILVGTIDPSGPRMKVRMRLLDVVTGKVQYTLSVDTPRFNYRKGWVQLFPFIRPESNEKYEKGENRIKPVRELELHGTGKGTGFRLGDFRTSTIMKLQKLQKSKLDLGDANDNNTAIRIESRGDFDENFEIEIRAHCGGSGGAFILLGWQNKNKSGYLIEHVRFRLINDTLWHVVEMKNGKAVKDLGEFNRGYMWPQAQPMKVTMKDKRLSISFGKTVLLKEKNLENYKPGDILIGTFRTPYGSKNLLIKSIKVRSH